MTFPISQKINFRNFGYIPTGSIAKDLKPWLFGEYNLIKRLQSRDIINKLDLKPTDRVLDLGCGNGYITIELAKVADYALGVDINSYISTHKIPDFLQGKLEFRVTRGEKLNEPDGSFDVILASEVLVMLTEPQIFLKEVKRLLKPGGRVVFVNGVGRVSIKEAFENNDPRIVALREQVGEGFPGSFQEYEQRLVKSFGAAIHRFISEDEYCSWIEGEGLTILERDHSPKEISSDAIYWRQMKMFLKTGKSIPIKNFPLWFTYLKLIGLFSNKKCRSGSIVVARK